MRLSAGTQCTWNHRLFFGVSVLPKVRRLKLWREAEELTTTSHFRCKQSRYKRWESPVSDCLVSGCPSRVAAFLAVVRWGFERLRLGSLLWSMYVL